jgi:hypothetical protein
MVNFISEILSKDFEAIINMLLYVKECNEPILPQYKLLFVFQGEFLACS